MYKVAICDDEREIRRWLEEKLEKGYGNRLNVSSFCNAGAFMDEMNTSENHKTDIVLMDIKLQDANGIEVIKQFQANSRAKIIFITGYLDYAQDIFKVNPSYLLKKPLDENALYEAIDKVIGIIEEENKECYTVFSQGCTIRVKMRDIFYFESEKRKVILHTKQGNIETYKKLNEVEKELDKQFVRCHQSFLVNMDEIENLGGEVIRLYDGNAIPISRTKLKVARDKFMQFVSENI